MKKKGKLRHFFEKFYKSPIEEGIDQIGKGLEETRMVLIKTPEQKEIVEIGGEFGLFFDRFMKNILVEKWEGLSGKLAKNIMNKPKIIKMETKVSKIAEILKGDEEIVFVLDKKGNLVGQIAENDLVKLLVPADKIINEIGLLGSYDRSYFGKTANDIMRKQVIIVTPSTPIEKVAYLMNKNDLIAIAVVKAKNIIGVVHARDLMRFVK